MSRRLPRGTLLRHVVLAAAAAVVAGIVIEAVDPFPDYQLAAVGLFAIAAAGLTILIGLNGQLSLGHGALMAVGAYTTSLLLKHNAGLPPPLVMLASVATAALAAALVGAAAARLRGPYLAGATLALAVGLPGVTLRFSGIFGGDQGLSVPPLSAPDFLGADFPAERWLAFVSLAAALVTFVLLANLKGSRFGRDFRAVRDDEVAAALAGIRVARNQVTAFILSGACAGLAGSLFAYWTGLTAPAGLGLPLSLQVLAAVVIGGLGSGGLGGARRGLPAPVHERIDRGPTPARGRKGQHAPGPLRRRLHGLDARFSQRHPGWPAAAPATPAEAAPRVTRVCRQHTNTVAPYDAAALNKRCGGFQ
jgi:branched-chain amino acid transport system permease protein